MTVALKSRYKEAHATSPKTTLHRDTLASVPGLARKSDFCQQAAHLAGGSVPGFSCFFAHDRHVGRDKGRWQAAVIGRYLRAERAKDDRRRSEPGEIGRDPKSS